MAYRTTASRLDRDQALRSRILACAHARVVEDNSINQLVTRGMLLKLGYRVCTADNGAEALEQIRREPIDAVLLDCQMPVMDGFATCRALRAMPGCVDLPVLAITAHSHSGDRERCLAVGMSDYMAKPVKFEELRALLHDWLLCKPLENLKSLG